jgi:hypothetical protein
MSNHRSAPSALAHDISSNSLTQVPNLRAGDSWIYRVESFTRNAPSDLFTLPVICKGISDAQVNSDYEAVFSLRWKWVRGAAATRLTWRHWGHQRGLACHTQTHPSHGTG